MSTLSSSGSLQASHQIHPLESLHMSVASSIAVFSGFSPQTNEMTKQKGGSFCQRVTLQFFQL